MKMKRAIRKFYKENGIRLLFHDRKDFSEVLDALSIDRRVKIEKAGKNRWTPDQLLYPYYVAISSLEDADYIYLNNILAQYESSEINGV